MDLIYSSLVRCRNSGAAFWLSRETPRRLRRGSGRGTQYSPTKRNLGRPRGS